MGKGTGFLAAAVAALALGANAATMSPKAAAVVMDQGSRLPAGYTQLEYLENRTDNQGYFDLGVRADFQSRTEAKVLFAPDSANNCNFWGSRVGDTKIRRFVFGVRGANGLGFDFAANQQKFGDGTYEINKPYLVDIDCKALTYSTVLDSDMQTGFTGNLTPPAEGDVPADGTMFLFTFSRDGSGRSQWGTKTGSRLYYFRYYNGDGEPVLDLVPVRRDSDGETGFYDLVKGTFITKSEGTFTAGPALKVVDGDTALSDAVQVDDIYVKDGATLDLAGTTLAVSNNIYIAFDSGAFERVDYIHVDSNVVFKTGYRTQTGDQAQIDIMFGPDGGAFPTRSMVPFFSRTSSSANLLSMWHWRSDSTSDDSRKKLRFDYGSSGSGYAAVPDPEIAADTLYRFTVYSGGATAQNLTDGTALTLGNSGYAGGTAEGAYVWLLGGIDDNTASNEGTGKYNYFCTNTKLYGFQVTNGDAVQCHFVPVRRKSDGAAGIYDIAGGLGFVEPTIVGAGKATAALEVKTEQYKRLDWLHVDNNVVFKTGYKTQAGDQAQIDIMFGSDEGVAAGGSMVPFFSRTSSSENLLSMWHWRANSTSTASQKTLRFDYASSGNSYRAVPDPELAADTLYRFTLFSGGATARNLSAGTDLTLNNTQFASGTAKGAYMWLLGGTGGNTTSNEGTGTLQYFCTNTKFYDFQVSNGGVVQCHFVPVKRASDGKVGIYDIAGGLGFVEASGTGVPAAGEETGEAIERETGGTTPAVIRETRFVRACEADGGITLKGGAELQSSLVLGVENGAVDMSNVALSGNIRVSPAVEEGAVAPALANARIVPDGTGCVTLSGFAAPFALTVDFTQFDFTSRREAIPVLSAGGTAPDTANMTVEGLPKRWRFAPSRDGSHLEAARNPAMSVYIR